MLDKYKKKNENYNTMFPYLHELPYFFLALFGVIGFILLCQFLANKGILKKAKHEEFYLKNIKYSKSDVVISIVIFGVIIFLYLQRLITS